MFVFSIFELFVVVILLYIAANLIRYLFLKGKGKNVIFGLSDKWLEDDIKKREEKKNE